MTEQSPEIGLICEIPGARINYHDLGRGNPLLLVHGSGPGVSAWANWRGVMPELSRKFRVVAPDMVGFGYTATDAAPVFSVSRWVEQLVRFLDQIRLEKVDIIGNSFGGAIALHVARAHPQRLGKIVLMGAVSLPFALTDGLDKVWGYQPSEPAMRELMNVFAYDKSLITDDLIASRHQASMQRGMDKVYSALFPAPRQRWVDALAQDEASLRSIAHPTLIVHGRDDQVIPLQTSIRLLGVLPNADLHVFAHCGHWTQIEKRDKFVDLVTSFLAR